MKKMILLSSIFAAGVLFAGDADPQPTTVTSITEVGVMGLTTPSAGKATLIAVPFLGYTTDAITVADMVNTAELAPGSKLHVPNTDGTYDIWTLRSDKKWEKPTEIDVSANGANESEGVEANAVQTDRGGAFWLEPAEGSEESFYLLGKPAPASDSGTSKAVAGKWNLIGNASANTLNTLKNAVTKRDQVAIQIDGEFRYYTYMESNGWCYQDPSTGKVKSNQSLPVTLCQGLWFKPAGDKDLTIDWADGKIAPVEAE